MMLFPASAMPSFDDAHAAITTDHLRYEDVTQDGRLIPLAVAPSLGGLWRSSLATDVGHKHALQTGILPLLTRMTEAGRNAESTSAG